ncbi:MAG: T9SS type A sorting domain-containing protein, partial [Candidatus Kapaibacterium sp.]
IVKLGNKPVSSVKATNSISTTATNFPNPFSDKTHIQFGKAVESVSQLIIYNVLGEEIRALLIPAGTESITLNREKLPTGIYVYHLVSAGIIIGQGRMVVQ